MADISLSTLLKTADDDIHTLMSQCTDLMVNAYDNPAGLTATTPSITIEMTPKGYKWRISGDLRKNGSPVTFNYAITYTAGDPAPNASIGMLFHGNEVDAITRVSLESNAIRNAFAAMDTDDYNEL